MHENTTKIPPKPYFPKNGVEKPKADLEFPQLKTTSNWAFCAHSRFNQALLRESGGSKRGRFLLILGRFSKKAKLCRGGVFDQLAGLEKIYEARSLVIENEKYHTLNPPAFK